MFQWCEGLCVLRYLSRGSVGPGAWLLELSPEVPVFWVPACCPSCSPPWPWGPMFPKGGKELGLAGGWPEDVTRLLEDAGPFPDPLLLVLLLLLGTEEPAEFTGHCWPTEPDVELDCCVDDDWLDEGGGLDCVRRELSNGCEARYGAKGRKHGINNINHTLKNEKTPFELLLHRYQALF